MTEWKTISSFEQKDEVGNIYQKKGGVIPKACQKCGKKFYSEIKNIPITQSVPFYKCKNCSFENAGGDSALDHKITTDHEIKKISKDRIVGYNSIIEGSKSNIIKSKNDVIILCDECKWQNL